MLKHTSLVTAFLAAVGRVMTGTSIQPTQYRGGTPSKHRRSGNDKWREAHPGESLDMKRYQSRYGGIGINRTKYPFSAKRK